MEDSLNYGVVKKMFPLTVFETLLFQGSSILGPAQQVPGSEGFSFKCKTKKVGLY